jgi:hypothetical protein
MIQMGPESRSDWMLKRFESGGVPFAALSNKRNEKNHGATLRFWNYGNHPEEIFSEKFFWTKLNYIHMNPIRAKIVLLASDYLYSSASNYVGKKSIFDGITLMNNPIIGPVKNDWTKDIDNW